MTLVKIGRCDTDPPSPVDYGKVWERQTTSNFDRLLISASERGTKLMLALAQSAMTEFGVLYVLLVPRLGEREPGRYQSPGPLSLHEVVEFIRRFAEYFDHDGRHHLWIGAPDKSNLLVYDRHNRIFAYGDFPKYIDVLEGLGFVEGDVSLPPDPHCHCYHDEYDADEEALFAHWPWKHFPLHEMDDE